MTIAINLVKILPDFDSRLNFLVFSVTIVLLVDLAFLLKKFIKLTNIVFVNAIALGIIVSLLICNLILQSINTDIPIIISVVLFSATLTFDIIWTIFRPKFVIDYPRWLTKAVIISSVVLNIIILFAATIVTLVTVTTRPYVLTTKPGIWENMETSDQNIEIEFDLPINKNDVVINLAPEVKGTWLYEKQFLKTDLYRKIVFIPEESFFPEQKIVIYLVGLKQIASGGDTHEQPVELFAPKIPTIITSQPKNGDKNYSTSEGIELILDTNDDDFALWEVKTTPTFEFQIERDFSNKILIIPKKALEQDTEYTIEVLRTLRTYNLVNLETIKKGDTTEGYKFSFHTVTTPLLNSYQPQGQSVLSDAIVKVVFDEKMNPGSVEQNFSFSPQIEGTVTWEDEKTFIFTPTYLLSKDTNYELVFKEGLYNIYGGKTNQEIKISFRTIGKVKVSEVYPGLDQRGLDPNSTNIAVRFDQDVDHQSAQSHFWVYPEVPADFSWDGNVMTYNTSGKLLYSTRYSFGITPGITTVNGLDSDQEYSYAFVTKDNIVSLGVPQYYQPYGSFICNVVAAKMVLSYYGIYRNEYDIINGIGYGNNPNTSWVNNYGTHWDPIANYISSQGRPTEVRIGMSVSELATQVQNGHPVIIWWYNGVSSPAMQPLDLGGGTGYRGMHSEVVIGFIGNASNPSTIITNDPWLGPSWYSTGDFVANWGNFGYTGVITY